MSRKRRDGFRNPRLVFRTGRSAMDNLFTLSALIDDTRHRKGSLYLSFIDVQKAYDSVDRSMLWRRLEEMGIPSSVVAILQSLYQDTTRRITWRGEMTEPFHTSRGLRQGCPLSPTLFALYIASIPDSLKETGAGVMIDGSQLPVLCYADDLVLISRSHQGTKRLMQCLLVELKLLKLQVNFSKSEILKLGIGTQQKLLWQVVNEKVEIEGDLQEAEQAKYSTTPIIWPPII